jgi:hypothetical protein
MSREMLSESRGHDAGELISIESYQASKIAAQSQTFSAEWRISSCIMINVENVIFERKILVLDLQRL